MHARFRDGDFPIEAHEVGELRAFFDEWADELAV